MKLFKNIVLLLFILSGCSGDVATSNSIPCSVSSNSSSATISCPDGTVATVPYGTQGIGAGILSTDEPTACNGVGGVQIVTFTDPNNTGVYQAGDTITSTSLVCNGAAGTDGQNGISSVIVSSAASASTCPTGGWTFTITTGNVVSEPYSVCNGAVGATGSQGPQGESGLTALTPIALIAPCGTDSSQYKEQLILLNDGSLLVDFSEDMAGEDTRLALLPDGNYIDTDESGCTFNVSTNMRTLTRDLSWNAGSSSAEPNGWAASSVTPWTVPASFNPSIGE